MTIHSLQNLDILFFNQRIFANSLKNSESEEAVSNALNRFLKTLSSEYRQNLNDNRKFSLGFSKDLSQVEFVFSKEKVVSLKIEEFTRKKGFFKKIESPAFVLFKLIQKVAKVQNTHTEINIEALKKIKADEKKVSKIKQIQRFFTSRISDSTGTIGKITGLVASLLGDETAVTTLIEATDKPVYMVSYAMAAKTHKPVDHMRKDLGMMGKMERLKSTRYLLILSVGLLISIGLILMMFPYVHALAIAAFGVYALNMFFMISGIYSAITSLMGITFQSYMLYKTTRFAKKLKTQQAIHLKEKTPENYQIFLQTIQDKLIISDQKCKILTNKMKISQDDLQDLFSSKQRKKLYKFKTVTSANTVDFILRYIQDLISIDPKNITYKNIETLNHFYWEKLEKLIDKRLKTNKPQQITRLERKIKRVNATLEVLTAIEIKLNNQTIPDNLAQENALTNDEIETLKKIYMKTIHLISKRIYKDNHAQIITNRAMVALYVSSLAVASLGFIGELFHIIGYLPGVIKNLFSAKINAIHLSEIGIFRKIGAIFRPAIYLILNNAEIANPLKRYCYKHLKKRTVDSYCPD